MVDSTRDYNYVLCGWGTPLGCKLDIPGGTAHIVTDLRWGGVLFHGECCPCATGEVAVKPLAWRAG